MDLLYHEIFCFWFLQNDRLRIYSSYHTVKYNEHLRELLLTLPYIVYDI